MSIDLHPSARKVIKDLTEYKQRAMDETRRRRMLEVKITALEAENKKLRASIDKLETVYRKLEIRFNVFRRKTYYLPIKKQQLAFLNWVKKTAPE